MKIMHITSPSTQDTHLLHTTHLKLLEKVRQTVCVSSVNLFCMNSAVHTMKIGTMKTLIWIVAVLFIIINIKGALATPVVPPPQWHVKNIPQLPFFRTMSEEYKNGVLPNRFLKTVQDGSNMCVSEAVQGHQHHHKMSKVRINSRDTPQMTLFTLKANERKRGKIFQEISNNKQLERLPGTLTMDHVKKEQQQQLHDSQKQKIHNLGSRTDECLFKCPDGTSTLLY